MNIYQRIAKVMEAVSYVKKDATVSEGGNYKAVSHDQVTSIVRQHFVANGIVVVPKVIAATMIDTGRKSAKGNPAFRYEGRFEIAFVNVEAPEDRIVITLDAHADDFGDKAPGKALSYAVKGATLKVLYLETGENDESRTAPEPEFTEEEQAIIDTLRAESLKGMKALEKAWKGLGSKYRFALMNQIDSLQKGAADADAGIASTIDKEAAHA